MIMNDEYYFSIGAQWIFWLVNVLTFCVYAWDKRRALLSQRRIPEAILIIIAFLGGALGALCGMLLFRHKIRKPLFYITVPILTFLQLAVFGFLCWKQVI